MEPPGETFSLDRGQLVDVGDSLDHHPRFTQASRRHRSAPAANELAPDRRGRVGLLLRACIDRDRGSPSTFLSRGPDRRRLADVQFPTLLARDGLATHDSYFHKIPRIERDFCPRRWRKLPTLFGKNSRSPQHPRLPTRPSERLPPGPRGPPIEPGPIAPNAILATPVPGPRRRHIRVPSARISGVLGVHERVGLRSSRRCWWPISTPA